MTRFIGSATQRGRAKGRQGDRRQVLTNRPAAGREGSNSASVRRLQMNGGPQSIPPGPARAERDLSRTVVIVHSMVSNELRPGSNVRCAPAWEGVDGPKGKRPMDMDFGVWILLTWTRTLSQLIFGLGLSLLVALGCAFFGPVAAPWAYLSPRRLLATVRLFISALGRIVRANLSLARRIWSPSLPLRSGMVDRAH